MTDKELSDWFINKVNSCYAVKDDDYPDSVFWYYNESYVRKKKLCKIQNQELTTTNEAKGCCLFTQISKGEYLYCNYTVIWYFLEQNYINNYSNNNIQILVNSILKNSEKFKNYIPIPHVGEMGIKKKYTYNK